MDAFGLELLLLRGCDLIAAAFWCMRGIDIDGVMMKSMCPDWCHGRSSLFVSSSFPLPSSLLLVRFPSFSLLCGFTGSHPAGVELS